MTLSCVIGIVFRNFAIISGDMRMSNSDEITSEKMSKVFKVNNKVLVGMTGSAQPVITLKENGYFSLEDCPSAEDYFEFLWLLTGNKQVIQQNQSNVLVIGVSKEGIGFGGNFHMDGEMPDNQLYISEKLDGWSPILTPPSVNQKYYQKVIDNRIIEIVLSQTNIQNFSRGMLIKNIKELHREIILEISKKDKSVNSNIEQYVIKW